MNIINVGFRSNKWKMFKENSANYEPSKALSEGNPKVAKHIVNAISNLMGDDYNTAFREAHLALKHSRGEDSPESDETKCPFCQGDGILEFEYQRGHNNPSDIVEGEAQCIACNGNGRINSYDLLALYDASDRPEKVIENILRGNMTGAKKLAQEIMNAINSHYDEVLEKSIDKLR